MPLQKGSKLGPYEIDSLLGAGGMGEVYRARDARLGREVAIKVLPASFSKDPDRLRRFEQEARAAGLLNHPNILAIYDVGTHEGAPYVVSELLEGQTLRERLKEGPLSARKAVEYSVEIARGLAAAHEKGIVHRDLKPENLFITRDERVKILDFGLAKLLMPEPEGDATSLPTVAAHTDPGVVMGTVGYMSPEQVRGKPTDARSDIFSLGAILYEMLAGERAFQRDSSVETMNAILKEEPAEFVALGKGVPPALERVVTHCLEKNPDLRFQSARDLAFALGAISGVSTGAVSGAAQALPGPRFRLSTAGVTAAALAALVALAVGYFAGSRGVTPASVSQPVYHSMTFSPGTIFNARFAPDGKTIVYAATWGGGPVQIYTVRTEFPQSQPVSLKDASLFGVSSTGEIAVSVRGRLVPHSFWHGTLASCPISGGTPRELLDNVEWADWSPDGSNLAVVHVVAGKRKLEYPIGKVLYETPGWISHIRISPRGDQIAFLDHPAFPDDRGSVAVVDLNGKKTTLSTGWEAEEGLTWAPSGKEIWFSATQAGTSLSVYAVTLSGKQRTVASAPGGMYILDAFPDGRALVVRNNQRLGIMGLAAGERAERDLSWFDWSIASNLSADGKVLAFTEAGEGGGATYAACIRGMDGSPPVRLGEGAAGAISPDGKWVISDIPGNPERLVLLPTGAGSSRAVGASNLEVYTSKAWMPDGKAIIYSAQERGHAFRVYLQDVNGGTPKPLTPEGVRGRWVSPQGNQFLAEDSEGKWWLYPLSGGQPSPVTGIEPDEMPVEWSADGRSLYLTRYGLLTLNVYQLDLGTHQRKLWKTISPAGRPGLIGVATLLMTPDGKAYAYSYGVQVSDLYLAEGLK